MKLRLILPLVLALAMLASCASGTVQETTAGSTSETTAETTAAPETTAGTAESTHSSLYYGLELVCGGVKAHLDTVEVPSYDASVFTASEGDGALADAAPTLDMLIQYYYGSSCFSCAMNSGAAPDCQLFWYFSGGSLVAHGGPGTVPDEEGEYLLYIDFLTRSGGGFTARRTAVKLVCTRADSFDALAALGEPRGDALIGDELPSDEFITGRAAAVIESALTDPVAVGEEYLRSMYADELSSADPKTKIDELKVLESRQLAHSYLDIYNLTDVGFRYAVKPASSEYYAYSANEDERQYFSLGEGELEGWIIREYYLTLKPYPDGVWLRTNTANTAAGWALGEGFVCPEGSPLRESVYAPSTYALSDTAFAARTSFLTIAPDRLDWTVVRDTVGLEKCREIFAFCAANAFSGTAATPQSLYTAAVMLAANNICPELSEDYSNLLKQLRAYDGESFAYSLTQVSEARAAEIAALLAK